MKSKFWHPGRLFLAVVMTAVLITLAACTGTTATVTSTATTTATATVTTTATATATVTTTAAPTSTAPATTPAANAIPTEVTQYAKDWPLPGKDYANSRATTDSSITAANVSTLGAAWAVGGVGMGLGATAKGTDTP